MIEPNKCEIPGCNAPEFERLNLPYGMCIQHAAYYRRLLADEKSGQEDAESACRQKKYDIRKLCNRKMSALFQYGAILRNIE